VSMGYIGGSISRR